MDISERHVIPSYLVVRMLSEDQSRSMTHPLPSKNPPVLSWQFNPCPSCKCQVLSGLFRYTEPSLETNVRP
ncbi:hypothetical protein M378DRAFT_161754 [Amanita muscaria Koide BX008]|uniref:Uncharacterized protein n=1 Tax=Amanita muscaria (strain Koide BX008) TaxID=946122 RepID=A0A0C2TFW2_AMAMK|nr:hypothetical protein M378DRAFT_161754 [Amanita muscaria Koide BX008]